MANTRVNIDVNINTSDAARNLRQLQAQINSFQSALNTNNRLQGDASRYYSQQIKDLANQSGMFSAETVKMRTAASQLDQTLSKGQGTMRQFVSAKFLKDSAAAAQVLSLANSRASALQTQFLATGAAANGFREAVAIRPLQAFNSETAISAQKLAIHRAMLSQSTTSMINFGKNTQWAGRQLMVGFTVPLTIFAATAGKVFREIEKESLNFRKVYGDSFTTPEELNANLLAVQGLAKEYTKYGIAVKDTIGLAAQAAAAGSQGADLIDATTEATRLATLGQMDQNQALETTIALQTAFNLSGEDLSKTINFLNMVENQTVVTLQDLAQAIPRVAPVIKGLGGSVEDMAVMLAAMREGGITAAQGANALKSGLASLINPTDRAVESLDKMGINLNSIINMNRGDLLGTVKSFGEALATLDDFSRQQALEKVFGKFQYARLGALFNNIVKDGSQASRVMDTATMSAEQLAKSAEKELGAIEDSSAIKFVAAMEKLKLAIAPIGQMFTELATPVLGFLGSLVDKFNELPDFAKKFIGFGTVITGIIIPAGTMFLGLLMNLAGTLTKFGLVVGVAFKGFAQGGLKGSVEAVSQALNFMSLAEIDAATASSQLGTSTEIVNAALRDQVPAAAGADAAIDTLSRSYAALIVQMTEAATLSRVAFVAPGAAMAGAAATGAEAGRRRGGPRIRRNSGGTIPGSGNTDTVPAMLTPGEFVVNKQATGENLALLHAINKGREVPGFNKGGQIPGMQYFGTKTSPGGKVKEQPKVEQQSDQEHDEALAAKLFGLGKSESTESQAIIKARQALGKTLEERVQARFADSTDGFISSTDVKTLLGETISISTVNRRASDYGVYKSEETGHYRWNKSEIERLVANDLKFEKAHFGTRTATNQDVEDVMRARGGDARARLAERLHLAGIPVRVLTDDWAVFSRGLNQAANRSKTETMTIEQAIQNILEHKDKVIIGPAMRKAGVSQDTFVDQLIASLRKYPNQQDLFTDEIFTSARNSMLPNPIDVTATGLRIPTRGDLEAWASSTDDKKINEKLNSVGFEMIPGSEVGKDKTVIRRIGTDEFERIGDSTGYKEKSKKQELGNGGMASVLQQLSIGGVVAAANAARGARGRIPANIVEWFSRMTTSISQSNRDDMLQNIPANIRRGLSTARRRMDITRGSVDPIDGGTLKEVSSWSRGQGVGRFMESSKLFETMNNSKFQIAQRSQSMKRDIDWLKSLGPDGPHPMQTWSPFHKANGGLHLRLTPEEIQESGGVIWKANKKKLEERIRKDQEFIAGHQKIINDLRESNIPTIYKTSVKKGEKYFDVSDRIVPREDQRLNNPAASNAILEEKEVALLGARLTGRAKTRIVEREEAQARYDKAKEEIKRIRMAIFNKKMSAEEAKPDLDRLHDETENMAAFVNWGRGREVTYPSIVSRNIGGIIPQMRNIGGQIFDSTKTSKTIVPGVGNKDTVPAALTPGEFVINKDATKKNLDLLRSINNGSVSRYALGGVVRAYALGDVVDFGNGEYMVEGDKGRHYGPMTEQDAQRRSSQLKRAQAARIRRTQRTRSRQARADAPNRRMMGGRGMGASMGLGAIGSTMMMAPMFLPGLEENATLSSAMPIAGAATTALSTIAMLPPPVAIAAAAIAALGAAAVVTKTKFDEISRSAADAGSKLGGTANRMEKISAATGYKFAKDRVTQRDFRFSQEEGQDVMEFAPYFESESGQKLIEELKNLKAEDRYKEVGSIIAMAVADGMDLKTAKAYGQSIAFYTNDALLKFRLEGAFKRGEFRSGTDAMTQLIESRVQEASKIVIPEPPDSTSSPLSQALGTTGTTNLIGEAALSTLPVPGVLASLSFVNETLEEQGNFFERLGKIDKGDIMQKIIPGGSIPGLIQDGQKFAKTVEATGRVFGSSIQILKEVDNLEAAIIEQRRKGSISADEYAAQIAKVRQIQDVTSERLKEAFTLNQDIGVNQQAISSQLILGGFEGDLAGAISNQVNEESIGEKLFQGNYDKNDEAQKQAVAQVMTQILSGLTPENAASRLAEIETVYRSVAEEIVSAAADGVLTAAKIKSIILAGQIENFAETALAAPDSGKTGQDRFLEGKQNTAIKTNLTELEKSGEFQLVGGLTPVTQRLSEFKDVDFARTISASADETKRFVGFMKELDQYKKIDIEVLMETEEGRSPSEVAKDVKKTLKEIGKLKFKGVSKEIVSALPNLEEFINLAKAAGKEFKDMPSLLEKVATQTQLLDPKGKGEIKTKQIKSEVIVDILGTDIDSANNILSTLQSAFPDTLDPMFIPLVLAFQNPEALRLLSQGGPIAEGLLKAYEAGDTSYTYSRNIPKRGKVTKTIQLNQANPDVGAKTPKLPGSDGAGEKSMIQQLKEQFKSLQDVYQGFAKNINKKTGMFKDIAAGPFGQQFINHLMSQGEEGIKVLKEKGKKFNEAYKAFVNVQIQASKNFMQRLPSLFNQQRLEMTGQKLLTDQLSKQGFSEAGIETILSGTQEGEMAAFAKAKAKEKVAKAKKKRGEKLTEKEKLTKDEKAILNNFSPASTKQSLEASQKLDKEGRDSLVQSKEDAFELEKALSKAIGTDIDPQVIDTLSEMGFTAEEVAANYDEISKYAQKLNDVLTQTSFTDEMKDLSEETKNANTALDLIRRGIPADIANQISGMANAANFTEDQVAELVTTMEKLEILKLAGQDPAELRLQQMMNQESINQLEYEIDLIESINADANMKALYTKEEVSNHEDLLAIYERQNEAKSRQIELRQRDLEPLDEEIKKLEEQKTKIEENYDAQSEALDEVIQKENELFAIKAKSLDVAGALSRGDVAGAARAALELERELSQQRAQDQKQMLDKQRQLSIEAIDTRIKTIADQKKVIEEDILRLQKEQRGIQDQIYNVQFIINEQAARLEGIYKLGNNQLTILKDQLIVAQVEQRKLNAAVQEQIDHQIRLNLTKKQELTEAPPPAAPTSGGGVGGGQSYTPPLGTTTPLAPGVSAPSGVSNQQLDNSAIINAMHASYQAQGMSKKAMDNALRGTAKALADAQGVGAASIWSAHGQIESANKRRMYGGKINKYAMGGLVNYKGSTERAPGMMYGGSAKKYAYGSMVPGRGMTDKVPALLTPGEFVVRKRVAEQYGPLLELLNGQVFPTMKTNSFNSSSKTEKSGSMYNYNVNVTLNGSDMDANDVANAVIQKIKMTENKGIRSNNIRG